MEVGHGIRGVLPHVEHEPIAALGHTLRLGHLAGRHEHPGQRFGVVGLEDTGVVDVAAGHHEHVHGRLGVEVAKGHGVLGAVHDLGGDLARDDAAEETVLVSVTDPVPVSYRVSARPCTRGSEPFTSG